MEEGFVVYTPTIEPMIFNLAWCSLCRQTDLYWLVQSLLSSMMCIHWCPPEIFY
jgi:hypothetical protein